MKYLAVTIMHCIMLLSLSGCNNKADKDHQPGELAEKVKQAPTQPKAQDQATIASEIEKKSKNSSDKTQPISDTKNNVPKNKNKPFSLNEYRKAMDAAVQDSIKE